MEADAGIDGIENEKTEPKSTRNRVLQGIGGLIIGLLTAAIHGLMIGFNFMLFGAFSMDSASAAQAGTADKLFPAALFLVLAPALAYPVLGIWRGAREKPFGCLNHFLISAMIFVGSAGMAIVALFVIIFVVFPPGGS